MTFVACRAVHAHVKVAVILASVRAARFKVKHLTTPIANHLFALTLVITLRAKAYLRVISRLVLEMVTSQTSHTITMNHRVFSLLVLLRLLLILSHDQLLIEEIVYCLFFIPIHCL